MINSSKEESPPWLHGK